MRRPALQPEPVCAITIMIISHTLYSAQDCTVHRAHVYREARARYMQRTVQYSRAPHCHRVSRSVSRSVTHCYLVLPSVTQCYSVSHVTRDRVTRSVCVVLMNSEGGSHGHIANIVAASNVTLQHIYN